VNALAEAIVIEPQLIRQRWKRATIPWRAIVWIIFAAVFWDAASLLIAGHTSAYAGISYSLLRQVPGGMPIYGFVLAAVLGTTVYAYGRSTAAPRDQLLRVGLSTLAAWYIGWTFAICWAWLTHWQAAGIGGLGRTVAFASVCWLAAYFAPRGVG
jgi:hypothetical protein